MIFKNVCGPPIAITSAPIQTSTIPASTANACNTARHDFVPTHEESSQSGKRNANKSGRKPLPAPSAAAPQIANRFSPFQQRQQQYAVRSENRARCGRSGPSKLECQKTGFTKRRNAAATPAQLENILLPRTNAAARQSPLTMIEIAANVRPASRKTTLTIRPNSTKNGYPGGWG